MNEVIEHGTRILWSTETGIEDLVTAVFADSNTDEIRRSYLTQLLMNFEIAVWEKREWDVVRLFEMLNFKSGISDPNPDDFDLVFQFRRRLDFAVNPVDRRRLSLAVWTIHTENLDDHDTGTDFRYLEAFLPFQPEITSVGRVLR